ncbi:MAG: hypothetical protein O2854_04390 [Chloroflexi bacterium]|nr:hypothetical protein [Chloroflexota bacterium]
MAVLVLATLAAAECEISGTPTPSATLEPTHATTPEPTPTRTAVPPTPTSTPLPGSVRGVSLSPKSYETDDFLAFWDLAAQVGNSVRWAGDLQALGPLDEGPEATFQISLQYDLIPLIEGNVFVASTGELLRPLDHTAHAEYIEDITAFVEEYKPPYLGIGVEINILQEHNPEAFAAFVELYADAAKVVRAISPDTQLYVTFQLERLRGLRGGLFGVPEALPGIPDPLQPS